MRDLGPLVPDMRLGDRDRYRVERRLGGGGFGDAYLVEDTRMGRLCVLKRLVLRSEWTVEQSTQAITSFEHEARLLTALNHPGHPNIPEIYEYLPESRALVMKYIEGESLHQLLTRRTEPLPETDALHYIHEVCAALVYMHSRTPDPVLHRDLKPANVMIDRTGRVWLIDFGLAYALPSTLTGSAGTERYAVGTLGYTPPEQWRGQAETRSDIYALAATLYELLTLQRPPHLGTQARLSAQHYNPLVRLEVEQLIDRGMTPDPVERPDAAVWLATIEQLQSRVLIAKPPVPARPPEVTPPLGRERELAELTQRLRHEGLVAITGMAGTGKTTLAATLAAQLAAPQRLFWYRCHPDEGPDQVLWALAALLAHNGQDSTWRQLQLALQTGSQPLPPHVLTEHLLTLLRGQDYLLCFEDAHQLPTTAHSLIRQLADAAGRGQVRLLLTARQILPPLPETVVVSIGGISREATGMLLEQQYISLSDAVIARLHRVTEGTPQFLTLAINALRNHADPVALVEQLEQLQHGTPRKPSGTRPFGAKRAIDLLAEGGELERYLLNNVDAGLSDDERKVMDALSVLFGGGGTRDLIEALLDSSNLRRTLNALVTRHMLSVESRVGGSVYYQHATVQAFYARQINGRMRLVFHQRAATFYEQEERDLFRAARHANLAGNHAAVARLLVVEPWNLINAGNARMMAELFAEVPTAHLAEELRTDIWAVQGEVQLILGNHRQASELLERAIAEQPAPNPTTVVRQARRCRLLSVVYERLGDYERSLAMVQQGLALADTPSTHRTETARLYAQRAEIALRQGALAAGIAACHAGLAVLPPEPAAPGERTLLLHRLATFEGDRGNYSAAIEVLEQTLGPAREVGDTLLEATVLNNLGRYCYTCGQNERARSYYTESIALNLKLGNQTGHVLTLTNLSLIHLATGARDEALRCFNECLALSAQLNLPLQQAAALFNLGVLHYEDGHLATAHDYLTQAIAIAETIGDRARQAAYRYLLGDVALAYADYPSAYTEGSLALELARRGGYQAYESCALRVIGEAHLGLGQLDAANTALSAAATLQEQIGDPYDRALIIGARAHLAFAYNQPQQALTLATMALEHARSQAIPHLERAMQALLAKVINP